MATIPMRNDPTLEAADAAHAAARKAGNKRRGYLGASQIGVECERALWYSFRFCAVEDIPPSGLRAIEDGERGELVMIERLQRVDGLELLPVDPSTGEQFTVTAIEGHFGGHMDGAALGLLQAPKTWHCWEAKVVNEKKFAMLQKLRSDNEKAALEQWDEVYFGQAQIYMGLSGLERHWLTCGTPGVRNWTSVRTNHQPEKSQALIAKARRIIYAAEPLEKISTKPEFYKCKMCSLSGVCHEGRLPPVSCRTCAHATPETDGNARWSCALLLKDLSLSEQKAACEDHVYIPALVAAEQVDASQAGNWVQYRAGGVEFKNGSPDATVFSSREMVAAGSFAMLGDAGVLELRAKMGATVEESAWLEAVPF